jgi:hypothetical protein
VGLGHNPLGRLFAGILTVDSDAGAWLMRKSIYLLAATAMGVTAFMPAARAQDMTTYKFGGTTLWIGGGFQYLTLPDIKFTARGTEDDFRRQKNSDFSEYGGAAGAGIETTLGYWNGMRVTGGVKGFFTDLENSDRKRCVASGGTSCLAFGPEGDSVIIVNGATFLSKTDRDVNYWGGQVEFKFGGGQPVHEKPNLYRNDYFIVGADIRGIDQDNKIANNIVDVPFDNPLFVYRETLDTTYTGGYIGLGGEYSFGFIPGVKNVGGLYDRLGLRTFVNVRAGLYNASTDYDGRFDIQIADFRSKVSESNDELAFIGTVSLETRKQIGMRTSLSLWTDYEYISSVPEMHYADEDRPTRISDDSSFATRTMLRLNIGLGSSQLYEEPLK